MTLTKRWLLMEFNDRKNNFISYLDSHDKESMKFFTEISKTFNGFKVGEYVSEKNKIAVRFNNETQTFNVIKK